MDSNHELGLLYDIEAVLSIAYQEMPALTDAMCIIALDNAIVAVKQAFGFARNETVLRRAAIDDIIANIVGIGVDLIQETGEPTLKDYIAAIKKVRKSVVLHSAFGVRGYGDVIEHYV